MKDHLCTLLITFNDLEDPLKETTTAHSFSSVDPDHYPQRRRVVHSTHTENLKSSQRTETSALTKRVSRSAHSAQGGHLGSDFVESRAYQSRCAMPTGVVSSDPFTVIGMREKTLAYDEELFGARTDLTSPKSLSHTCTSSSGFDSRSPTPSYLRNANIQEVTLTYMRESDVSSATRFGVPPPRSIHAMGGTDFAQRKKVDATPSVPPYTVRNGAGAVRYNYDELLQMSDATVALHKISENQKSNVRTVPMKIEKPTEKYAHDTANSISAEKAQFQQRSAHFFEKRNDSGGGHNLHKRTLTNESGMSKWNDEYKHRREGSSYESVENKSSRTIYERTTSEVTMSKSTTTTFHPTKHLMGAAQQQKQDQHLYQHQNQQQQQNYKSPMPENYVSEEGRSTRDYQKPPYYYSSHESRFEQHDDQRRPYSATKLSSPSAGGLPRYHDDGIRLHTRYDDDYVYRADENFQGRNLRRTEKPTTSRYTTTFPTTTESTYEESRNYMKPMHSASSSRGQGFDDTKDSLLLKMSPKPVWQYEFEEEEERYYERIIRSGAPATEHSRKESRKSKDEEPANKIQKPMTPFGSSKNFSDAAKMSRDVGVTGEVHRNFASSPPYIHTQFNSVETYSAQPQAEKNNDDKPMRFIDYQTYRQEVEQLQREAMGVDDSSVKMVQPIPLTPAVVLSPQEERTPSRMKYFTKSDLEEATKFDTSPAPLSTTISASFKLASRADEAQSLREEQHQKEFGEKIETIRTSPGFRPLYQEAPTLNEVTNIPSTKVSSATLVLSTSSATITTSNAAENTSAASKLIQSRPPQIYSAASQPNAKEELVGSASAEKAISSTEEIKPSASAREFQEYERQEYSTRHYQPASYQIASYTEEYDFRHRQEYSEERKRKPLYLEKATLQNVDICVENVSPIRASSSDKTKSARVSTPFIKSAGMTTFGVSSNVPVAKRAIETAETGTMPHKDPVKMTEAFTQDSSAVGVDMGTDPDNALNARHEIGIQAQNEETKDEEGTVTGRELLETLRRELQYEELIDLEVRRRQRVFNDSSPVVIGGSREDQLEPLHEEEDDKQLEESETGAEDSYSLPVSSMDEWHKRVDSVADELVDTFEPQFANETRGVTNQLDEQQTHSAQPSAESMELEVLSSTHTTDIPTGRILADVCSEAETIRQEDLEYESRTLTPSSSRRRPSSSTQPPYPLSPSQQIPEAPSYESHTQAIREINQYEENRSHSYDNNRDYYLPQSPIAPPSYQQLHYREFDSTRHVAPPHQPSVGRPTIYNEYNYQHSSRERFSPYLSSKTQPEIVSSTRSVTTFSPIARTAITANNAGRSSSETRHSRVQSPPPQRTTSTHLPRMEYNSGISQRQNFAGHHRRTMSPTPLSHRTIKTIQSGTSSVSSGLFSPYGGSTAASTIRDAREREKKEMSDLNDRFASYIEKVRFLEAQNRKLDADLEFLRNRWGRDTSSIRDMYEVDIKQAQNLIDDTNRQREEMKDTIHKLEEEIASLRRKFADAERARYLDKDQIDELLLKLSALEADIALLKRRIAILEEEVACTKRENHRLLNDLQHARNDLDQQTLNRIDYQNQVQTLIEEIDFLRRAHDSEIHDLQAMASRDTTSENREYFRSELASAIREIRSEYDKVCNVQRVDMESWYKLKVQEIQTQSNRQNMEQSYAKEEIRRLRVQLGDLRGKLADLEGRNCLLEKQAEELNYQLEDDQRSYESALNDRDSQIRKIRDECHVLMVELQMLLDTKQTLDADIAIYRKMLEGEEDRAGLRQLLEQVTRTHQFRSSDETESVRVLRGETSSRSSYQRAAKGNVAIREVAPDATYIIVENTHRSKAENIGEWKLRRRIDNGKRDIFFTFPPDFILEPTKMVKIWARNQGPYNPPDELVFDAEESFGMGNNVHNFLYNVQGEERASLIQRSNYTASTHQ